MSSEKKLEDLFFTLHFLAYKTAPCQFKMGLSTADPAAPKYLPTAFLCSAKNRRIPESRVRYAVLTPVVQPHARRDGRFKFDGRSVKLKQEVLRSSRSSVSKIVGLPNLQTSPNGCFDPTPPPDGAGSLHELRVRSARKDRVEECVSRSNYANRGVEVCKPRLDLMILPTGEILEFENSVKGIKQFVERPKPEATLPEGAWLGSRRC